MEVGDTNMNVQRVADHLHAINYPKAISRRKLREGDPGTLLELLHYTLLDYSPHVAAAVHNAGFALFAKDDASFTDSVFRFALLHLQVKPHLTSRMLLSTGFVERKLIFVVALIRACVSIHEEGERIAASKKRGPVPPYTAHCMLQPTSTRDYVRVQQREDRNGIKHQQSNYILPSRAHEYPSSSSAKGNSGAIYALGGSNIHNEGAGEGSAGSLPVDTVAPSIRFLSDAVALGQGVGASLAQRRKQAIFDVTVSAPTAAISLDSLPVAEAGWRERVTRDMSYLRAGGGLAGLAATPLPQPAVQQFLPQSTTASTTTLPSYLPIHRRHVEGLGYKAPASSHIPATVRLTPSPQRSRATAEAAAVAGVPYATAMGLLSGWPSASMPVPVPVVIASSSSSSSSGGNTGSNITGHMSSSSAYSKNGRSLSPKIVTTSNTSHQNVREDIAGGYNSLNTSYTFTTAGGGGGGGTANNTTTINFLAATTAQPKQSSSNSNFNNAVDAKDQDYAEEEEEEEYDGGVENDIFEEESGNHSKSAPVGGKTNNSNNTNTGNINNNILSSVALLAADMTTRFEVTGNSLMANLNSLQTRMNQIEDGTRKLREQQAQQQQQQQQEQLSQQQYEGDMEAGGGVGGTAPVSNSSTSSSSSSSFVSSSATGLRNVYSFLAGTTSNDSLPLQSRTSLYPSTVNAASATVLSDKALSRAAALLSKFRATTGGATTAERELERLEKKAQNDDEEDENDDPLFAAALTRMSNRHQYHQQQQHVQDEEEERHLQHSSSSSSSSEVPAWMRRNDHGTVFQTTYEKAGGLESTSDDSKAENMDMYIAGLAGRFAAMEAQIARTKPLLDSTNDSI